METMSINLKVMTYIKLHGTIEKKNLIDYLEERDTVE